jgi:hypothetical protein
MAILIKDNLNNVIFSDTNAPSGSFSCLVSSLVTDAFEYNSSRRLMFSGVEPSHGNGVIYFTGLAKITYTVSNKVFSSGRLSLSGNAPTKIGYSYFFDDGLVLRGRSTFALIKNVEGTGRLRLRGSAFYYVQSEFDFAMDGGLGVSSDPTSVISNVYSYQADQGLGITGYATKVKVSLKGGSSGGISFSAVHDHVLLGFIPVCSGKVSLNGEAGVSSSNYQYFVNYGSSYFTGIADALQGYAAYSTGSLRLDSFIGSTNGSVSLNVSVSMGLRGSALFSIADIFKKKFSWRIHEKVSFQKTFGWGVGERPFSFYRVSGKCKPAMCPPLQVNGCQEDSKFTYVVNIYARNLAEVCRKLRERNMIFPIATIEKFSTPASRIDYTDTTDPTCNKLQIVTPAITFLPCQDLLVDYNAHVDIGVSMKAVRVILEYECKGRIGLNGGVYPYDYFTYESFGKIGVSGTSTYVQKNHNYLSSGSIGLNGTIEKITLPVWDYVARGSINPTVSVEPVRVVHPYWFMVSSGSLGVVGNFDTMTTMKWIGKGEISTLNSTALGYGDYLPFLVDMTGNIGLKSVTDGSRGEYYYESLGRVAFTGLTHFLTPHITIEPIGRLRMSNSDGSVPSTSSNLGIKVSFVGSALVAFTPVYGEAGRVVFSGTANCNCSVVEPNGNVALSGEALIKSSDLGEIPMIIACEFFVKNENVLFAYDQAPVAVRPVKRIITQCCSQSLPLRLWIQHPLAGSNHFSKFLQRNNLLIDNPVQVYYNQTEKAWYNTLHFEGFAPDFPTIESWSITFGWSCSDHLSTDLALSNLSLYYRFSMMVTLRSVNNITIPHRVSKIVVGFDPSRACFNNKTFSFPFTFDTTAKTSNPSGVETSVYIDDIGLFKSSAYLKSPEIRFKVSEILADIPQAVVDIGSSVAGSQRLGSIFSGNILSSLPVG